jgi:hypothetical protein
MNKLSENTYQHYKAKREETLVELNDYLSKLGYLA